MKKTTTATVAEKTEPTRPPWAPKLPAEVLDLSGLGKPQQQISTNRLRHVNTDEIKKPDLSTGEVRRSFAKPLGTAEMHHGLSPIDFLAKNSTPDELRMYQAATLSRMAREGKTSWRTLPGGSRIRADHRLYGCPSCGKWMWFPPTATFCPVCNTAGLKNHRGQVRPATPEEEKAWFAREEKQIADYKRTVFNLQNLDRAKSGLEPLTLEQYAAEQRKVGERRQRDSVALGRIPQRRVEGNLE